jgi:hypothetical protein
MVFFDPPWGQDYSTQSPASQTKFDDSQEQFLTKLPQWLEMLYSVMSPNSVIYMFFGIVDHGFAYQSLERAGFETNWMPLIWHKRGAHRTRNPETWRGRSYEPIAYAYKGKKSLVLRGAPDYIETSAPTSRIKKDHPAAKHPGIYRQILLDHSLPGDKILDPMAGSGMLGVACESICRSKPLDWLMIEQHEAFRNLQIFNLHEGYDSIIQAPDETELSPEQAIEVIGAVDYKTLTPGTKAWTYFWNNNPDKQDEMLEWRKKQ